VTQSNSDAVSERTYVSLAQVSVSRLKGVGPVMTAALAEVGIKDVLGLLTTYPHRYLDRSIRRRIGELEIGEEATLEVTVKSVNARRTRRGQSMVTVRVFDDSASASCVFFNQPWWGRILTPDTEILLYAKARTYNGARQLEPKAVDVVGRPGGPLRTGKVLPVYPASAKAGVTSDDMAKMIAEALVRSGTFFDPVEQKWRESHELISRHDALHSIHQPESVDDVEPARRRLAFDELLRLQIALAARRRLVEKDARGIRHNVSALSVVNQKEVDDASLVERFLRGLPFFLTNAQRRALAAIFSEMSDTHPMHRLLQGDVGSGKTVVAAATLLAAVQGGHQGALMVPTEVLAEQHGAALFSLTDSLMVPDPSRLGGERPLKSALLTARTPAAQRRIIESELENGEIDVVVGTHALLSDGVRFHSLGAVVIDEQHRFGVDQRAALRGKGGGHDPDVLVMTATPIPRTAAMVLFGDLDQVVLDELPPGRTPIATKWAKTPAQQRAAWSKLREEIEAGKRGFVVCPLVEESDRVEATAATVEFERLGEEELSGLSLGLLHGQMSGVEKQSVMDAFRRGEIQVLVATTIIEVGVDVPEATVMVIEDAERFGIAQLHQLRGRVGRGKDPSFCFLLSKGNSEGADKRLSALEQSSDGFYLAEVDLEIRGQGTIFGTRQKGRSDLALATIKKDADLLEAAKGYAKAHFASEQQWRRDDPLIDEVSLFVGEEEAEFLFKN